MPAPHPPEFRQRAVELAARAPHRSQRSPKTWVSAIRAWRILTVRCSAPGWPPQREFRHRRARGSAGTLPWEDILPRETGSGGFNRSAQQCVEPIGWRLVVECLAGPCVELELEIEILKRAAVRSTGQRNTAGCWMLPGGAGWRGSVVRGCRMSRSMSCGSGGRPGSRSARSAGRWRSRPGRCSRS